MRKMKQLMLVAVWLFMLPLAYAQQPDVVDFNLNDDHHTNRPCRVEVKAIHDGPDPVTWRVTVDCDELQRPLPTFEEQQRLEDIEREFGIEILGYTDYTMNVRGGVAWTDDPFSDVHGGEEHNACRNAIDCAQIATRGCARMVQEYGQQTDVALVLYFDMSQEGLPLSECRFTCKNGMSAKKLCDPDPTPPIDCSDECEECYMGPSPPWCDPDINAGYTIVDDIDPLGKDSDR